MTNDSISPAEYRALISGGRCPMCGRSGKPKRHKYGASAVVDPETGTRIPSKHEMKVLARKRMEADALGHITALRPRFKVEGGFATFDGVEIRILTGQYYDRETAWYMAAIRLWDAKGKDHPAGRKSRKQVLERYDVVVQVVKE